MTLTTRLQLLTCLMVYVSSAHGIMVKFGTKGGPIEPPAPEPTVVPTPPFRAPAPVWEERSSDAPDPNAEWRPQPFKPQPRYTHIAYTVPETLTNAQRFVNSYNPAPRPVQAEPVKNYFTPAQFLSSQSLPGIGLRYFMPVYVNDQKVHKHEDGKENRIDVETPSEVSRDSAHELTWQYEKDAAVRNTRHTQEALGVPVYQWPTYIFPRQR